MTEMLLIKHPPEFTEGTRFMYISARRKDGVDSTRRISRISHNAEQHARYVAELCLIALPGERLYSSADARDIDKAAKYFKHAMIDEDTTDFFRRISARWDSALMQPTSRAGKLWLWDCDAPGDVDAVHAIIPESVAEDVYTYRTVSGSHVVTRPFDRRNLPPEVAKLRTDNAMLLWGFSHASGLSRPQSEEEPR